MGSINEDWLEKRRKDGMPTAYSRPYGLPEMTEMTTTEYGPTKDVEILPKWDIPEKVAIGNAPVGAFLSKRQNPNQPIQPDEIRTQARNAVEAGASYLHIHVRDPETGINTIDAELYHDVLDPILEDHPDIVIDGTTIPFADGDWEEIMQIYEDGLFDISPVNPLAAYNGDMVMYEPPDELIERTRTMQKYDVKPQLAVVTDADVHTAKRYLIDTDVVEEPYLWGILPAIPGGTYMPNPKAVFDGLTFQVERIQEIPGEHIINVCTPGRASTYVAATGMMMGHHVRVGMEDTPYEFPHRDDLIEDNGEEVTRFARLAEDLGREIATPDEYREIVGL